MKNSSLHLPKTASDGIDWESQWAQFAAGFKDGKAHIELSRFGTNKTLYLQPGPGFGDLSHPTTSLMLSFMKGEMQGSTVLDIGCGSGILALSALLMGASQAIGIDIDENALEHARHNANLNRLSARFSRNLPKNSKGVVLINMILSEQKAVLQEIPNLPSRASLWIASGFLAEQKKEAISFTEQLGLHLLEIKQEGEWIALKLQR